MRRSAAPSQTGAASLAKRQKFVSPATAIRPPLQSPTYLRGPCSPWAQASSSISMKQNTGITGNVVESSPLVSRFITDRPLSGQLLLGKNLNADIADIDSESTKVVKSNTVELSDDRPRFSSPLTLAQIFGNCSNNSPLVDSKNVSLYKSSECFELNSPQSSNLFKNVISDSVQVNVGQTSIINKMNAGTTSSDNSVSYKNVQHSDDVYIANKSELNSHFLYRNKQAEIAGERLKSDQNISNKDKEHYSLSGIKSFQNSKTGQNKCVNKTLNDQSSSKTFKHPISFHQKRSESSGHSSSPSSELDSPQSQDPQKENNPAAVGGAAASSTRYFSVVWCKMSKKKHKKWEGDAVMSTTGRTATLHDMDGKIISKSSGFKTAVLESLKEDETLFLGGKEVLVISMLSDEHFKSGKCFTLGDVSTSNVLTSNDESRSRTGIMGADVSKPFVSPSLKSGLVSERTKATRAPTTPKYDPNAPGALVLPRPSADHQWKYNKQGLPVVDVVVDPYLSHSLRIHQRSGVIFLYECVLGMRCFNGFGAILADDMGLGKTLQCICLIWTLLKQGPYGGHPIVSKVLVVTPGSLVKNWFAEFKKWLGTERINVFAVSTDNRVEEYVKTNVHPVLLISYEMFVRSFKIIKDQHIDLVICDEGHRLKNTAIKTTSLIMSLPCRRRVVLTGTPVQNDLQEFYSIVDFCNPGILGTSTTFHHVYEAPIIAAQQPEASLEQKELGAERTKELARLTHMFVLRRTQEINNDYLPPKVEMVLFCKPTPLQLILYRQLLHSNLVRACLAGSLAGSPHLSCISALRHLCNHPGLIYRKAAEENVSSSGDIKSSLSMGQQDYAAEESMYSGLLSYFPASFNPMTVNTLESGKLAVLAQLLSAVWSQSATEKVVLVSNHTKVLDVLEMFCKLQGYTFLRLDGQTPTAQRQSVVNSFNNKYSAFRIFLLSSKAGGVGLNLIGASRLVLYDVDWNPANDLQAMARVWRDGQKGKVFIYRLLTVGTIEEKMYQRQITKQGLSGAVLDLQSRKKTSVQFSVEDLKDLFTLNEGTDCETHAMLDCSCRGDPCFTPPETRADNSAEERQCQLGRPATTSESKRSNLGMSELLHWKHWKGEFAAGEESWRLQQAGPSLSFVFWHETLMT